MSERLTRAALAVALLAPLSWAALSLPDRPVGLTEASLEKLPESGVTNPVTAVLLNYRSYDTLLEVAVLLLAVVGAWSMRSGEPPVGQLRGRPLLMALLRVLLPVLFLGAGYLLWVGASAPGGAFQGGAVLAGAGVLMLVSGLADPILRRRSLLRAGLTLGVIVFAACGVAALVLTGRILQYPQGAAGTWILVIELAVMISIGLALCMLYLGGGPPADGETTRGDHGV